MRLDNLGPVEVTERIIALARHLDGKPWSPYGRNLPDGKPWTIAGRVAQARMWRQFAGAWDGIPIDRGYVGWPHGHRVVIGRSWVDSILKISKEECLRRSRVNFYLARRIRREHGA